jgi:hypothetical protein
MKYPVWTLKLAAAAVIPVAIGVGGAFSAPSPTTLKSQPVISDEAFVPGADGVDYALITGPRGPVDPNAVSDCADPVRRGDLPPC